MGTKLFFLIFLIIGLVALAGGYHFYQKSLAAKDWPTVDGKVMTSEISRTRSRSGRRRRSRNMYSADIVYEYSVDNIIYRSERVSFGDYRSSSPAHAREVVDNYPVGASVRVYFDPENPATAVLEPGTMGGLWIPFLTGGVFTFFGMLGVTGKIKPNPKLKKLKKLKGTGHRQGTGLNCGN